MRAAPNALLVSSAPMICSRLWLLSLIYYLVSHSCNSVYFCVGTINSCQIGGSEFDYKNGRYLVVDEVVREAVQTVPMFVRFSLIVFC